MDRDLIREYVTALRDRLGWRADVDDVADEVADHLHEHADRWVRGGLDPGEAQRRTLECFGDLGLGGGRRARTGCPLWASRFPDQALARFRPGDLRPARHRMARAIGTSAVLLASPVPGHTSFGRSTCIADHVVRYLVHGQAPVPGTTFS